MSVEHCHVLDSAKGFTCVNVYNPMVTIHGETKAPIAEVTLPEVWQQVVQDRAGIEAQVCFTLTTY